MQKQSILRIFVFIMFFSIGASAITVSILCDDIFRYYKNRQLLKYSEQSLDKLQSMNVDYDVLLEQFKYNPDFAKRIAPAILGTCPAEANSVYPKVTIEELIAAKQVLKEKQERTTPESRIPVWLTRCLKPVRRIILFAAGASLVLISFICFGQPKKDQEL